MSSQIPIPLKIVSENRFSGKTYFYTIASRRHRQRGRHHRTLHRHERAQPGRDPLLVGQGRRVGAVRTQTQAQVQAQINVATCKNIENLNVFCRVGTVHDSLN